MATYLTIAEICRLTGIKKRTLQHRVSADGSVRRRKRDKKTYLIDIASLPEDIKARMSKQAGHAPAGREAMPSPRTLGITLDAKSRLKAEVARYFNALPPTMPKMRRIAMAAGNYHISPNTVRNYLRDVGAHVPFGTSNRIAKLTASWSKEAKDFMVSWYLTYVRETNCRLKKPAIDATRMEAHKHGWAMGCDSSAYNILKRIPATLIKYAVGGDRALDNHFYIARSWDRLEPMEVLVGDQHICDWWVVDPDRLDDPYRPVLYVWLDGATRMVAGIAAGRGSYDSDTVAEALHRAVARFGLFKTIYTDNGRPECSAALSRITADLYRLSGGICKTEDLSGLYRTSQGGYVVEDASTGKPVREVPTSEEWIKLRGTIRANVKNAKAKPIERFFASLEALMQGYALPGKVVDPAADAAQEEKETANLMKWKRHDQLLTFAAFMNILSQAIDKYEHRKHSSLGMSPTEKMAEKMRLGWMPRRPRQVDLDFIFLTETQAIVRRGRVTIRNRLYIGEDMPPCASTDLDSMDRGLTLHEGEKIQVRFDKTDPETAYAILPKSGSPIRRLLPVVPVDMLDDDGMKDAIRWKRAEKKKVRELFARLAQPAGEQITSAIPELINMADRMALASPLPNPHPAIHKPESARHDVWTSDFERYEWCLQNTPLAPSDQRFVQWYESQPVYEDDRSRWEILKKNIARRAK